MLPMATRSTCLLFPEDPRECFEFGALAFDLAERLQAPVFVLLDLDIGMNEWLCEPLTWDDSRRYDRGKVLSAVDLEAGRDFGRYLDVGRRRHSVPYLSRHPPDQRRLLHARYVARPLCALHGGGQRLRRQHAAAPAASSRPRKPRAEAGPDECVGRPTRVRSDLFRIDRPPPCSEANEMLRAQRIELDLLRVRAFPFTEDVIDFVLDHDHVFVVEQNRDGQLRTC